MLDFLVVVEPISSNQIYKYKVRNVVLFHLKTILRPGIIDKNDKSKNNPLLKRQNHSETNGRDDWRKRHEINNG